VSKRKSALGDRVIKPYELTLHFIKSAKDNVKKNRVLRQSDISSEAGTIGIDPVIRSINLVDELRKTGQALPTRMEQYLDDLDFHKAEINLNLRKPPGWQIRGIKWFKIQLELTGKGVLANDIGPTTEWKPKGYSSTLDIGVDSGDEVGKLIPIQGSLTPSIKFTFKYAWNPQVSTITSGISGGVLDWEFNRDSASGTYLQGSHKLVFLFERPRKLRTVLLKLKKAEAKIDVRGLDRHADTIEDKIIRVLIKARKSRP